MATVYYFEYFCRCGEFLFRNSDIEGSTLFFGRNNLFVDATAVKVYQGSRNTARCFQCNIPLGGMLFYPKAMVRFCAHLIQKRKITIAIHRVVDENGHFLANEYHNTMIVGNLTEMPLRSVTEKENW